MVDYDTQNTMCRRLVQEDDWIITGFYNKENKKHGLVVSVLPGGSITEAYYRNGTLHGKCRNI